MDASSRRRVLIGTVLGTALLLASALGIRAYGLQQSVPPGLAAGGLQLGGLPLAEAERLIQDHAERLRNRKLLIASGLPDAGNRTATFASAGLRWDTSAAEAALKQLREGGPFLRAWHRLVLRGRAADPLLQADEPAYRRFVSDTWAELLDRQPSPARRVILESDEVHIIPDVSAYRVDEPSLLQDLLQHDWAQEWRRNDGGPGRDGEEPVAFQLPVREVKAGVTAEKLAEQGVDRKIIEFGTPIAPGDPGRFHNIVSAARTIHDRLLAPGEVFDYASVVKDTESRFGFREAPVIFNGKLVPGIGGGICHVSSTLYNAVLRAGLEIVERRSHSLPVSYVPLGQDATYSDGYINFKFRNNTATYLLIRTENGKDRLTVKLFGRLPEAVTYEIDSVTVEELEVPVKTVINPALKPGQSEILLKGKPGYIVETYRTKRQNGAILSKERVSRDRYSPQPTLMAVGGTAPEQTDTSPGLKPNVLEDGIGGPRFR